MGLATIYQDGLKFEVEATLFAEDDSPASFGHYQNAVPEGVHSGAALIRFSDGSEADAVLAEVDPDRGGFRIRGHLRELRRFVEP